MTTSQETLEAILRAQRFQAGAWARVIELSRQYAMMKATGVYTESGVKVSVSFSSRESMTKMFADNLLRAAEEGFVEDALVGAELLNTK